MTFKDHRIILTGASSGIGLFLAKQLAAEGARLALAARNVPALESAAEACRALGGQALVIPTDVSDQVQCRELITRTVDAWGGIDALFSNAGISMWARFEEVKADTTYVWREAADNDAAPQHGEDGLEDVMQP